MANDKRDDKINELQKGLEALRDENALLKEELAEVAALKGELELQKSAVSDRDKMIVDLRTELEQARSFLRTTDKKTVPGLPSSAAQLATGVTMSSHDRRRIDANPGDVVACGKQEDIDALRKRVGQGAKIHHVTRETFDEIVAKQLVRV
jgi:small-conductance mechanosensitive channel